MSVGEHAIKSVMSRFARNAELDEFLAQELKDAGFGSVDVHRTVVGARITLYVSRPGLVIGRRGMGIKELTEKIEKKFGLSNPQITVSEVEVPELNPRIMCAKIAHTVSRGTAFRRAANWTLNSIMNAGAEGVEIGIAGKLRSERSHAEKYRAGVVPKSGNVAKRSVVEAVSHVLLKMGLFGIKVRIALPQSVSPEFVIHPKKSPSQTAEKEDVAVVKVEGERTS